MTVYIEYAFCVNFLLDGLLLYLALKCARGKICLWRIILAATLGGIEAIIFPLLSLPRLCAYLVKILGGILLIVIAVKQGSRKTFFVATCSFFAMTFLFGGVLTAVYSCFGISYVEGNGYYVESAPVAFILATAGIFAVATLHGINYLYRFRKLKQSLFPCVIESGGRTVRWQGLADSGNCLLFRGSPVCVISAVGALALFRGKKPVGRMNISTVSGSRESPVFLCERMEVGGETAQSCYFTVGDISSKEYQLILHTALCGGVS